MALTLCSRAPVAWRLHNNTVLAGDKDKIFACFQQGNTAPSDGLKYSNAARFHEGNKCVNHIPMLPFLGPHVYKLHVPRLSVCALHLSRQCFGCCDSKLQAYYSQVQFLDRRKALLTDGSSFSLGGCLVGPACIPLAHLHQANK